MEWKLRQFKMTTEIIIREYRNKEQSSSKTQLTKKKNHVGDAI